MIMYLLYIIVVLLFLTVRSALNSHVVGLANYDYVSHHRVLSKLGKELKARGHKYTHLLPICAKESYNDIDVKVFNTSITSQDIEDIMLKLMKLGDLESSLSAAFRLRNVVEENNKLTRRFCEDLFKNEGLIAELNKTVDAVLCDVTSFCCFILAELLNVTRVDVSPVGFSGFFGVYLFSFPQGAVYYTQESSSEPPCAGTFSFTNRLLTYLSIRVLWFTMSNAIDEELWTKYAKPNSRYLTAVDALRTHGIGLIPHDFALEYPRPVTANIKVIGPILPQPPEDLPHDFDEFMTKNDQVILVSFGTTISKYRPELVQVIADGLSQLSIAVLWKHSGDMPKKIGSNIKIVSWIPQNDILGHPSTKVFVTHGGLNSFLESVYHGVPMVAMPLFGDQHMQATSVKRKRLGVSLDKNTMKPKDLVEAIKHVLDNNSYKQNAETVSAILKDRKRTPTEEGIDWIEYALRHNGALHLTSEALDLPEYQLYMFDVFLFLLIVGVVFPSLLMYLICHYICKRTTTVSLKAKQT